MRKTMGAPYNIQSHAAALAEGLSHGDRIHVGVCGNHQTDRAIFVGFVGGEKGIVVSVHGIKTDLAWGDIVELWSLEEKPNIYHSDVPEVAEKLGQLKSSVQKCVESNDVPGVLYLVDQVVEVKKASYHFKEARKILAAVRL